MIAYTITFIVGFVAGALVFRNNKTKADAMIERAKSQIDNLQK